MAAKLYPFDGQMLNIRQIQARWPAYTKYMIIGALEKMDPPAEDRHGLDRWCAMAKEKCKVASRINANLGNTQLIINENGDFARARKLQAEKHAWAVKQLKKAGKA